MSGGWTPNVSLFSQSRGKVVFDEATQNFLPGAAVPDQRSAGACRGVFDLAGVLADGANAGAAAAGVAPSAPPHVEGALAATGGALGLVAAGADAKARAKAFVDFQNDVTARDIQLATREGMRSIEHIKRYTTTGMATDQGKNSNLNALAIAAEALGKPIAEVGLTTFRPPYTPVTFGDLRRPRAARHVRSDPRDAAARVVDPQGREVRGGGPVEARLLFRQERREPRRHGAARMPRRRAPAPASWTPRRSARSRSSAPTPPNSSIGSTSIRSRKLGGRALPLRA